MESTDRTIGQREEQYNRKKKYNPCVFTLSIYFIFNWFSAVVFQRTLVTLVFFFLGGGWLAMNVRKFDVFLSSKNLVYPPLTIVNSTHPV